MAFTIFWTGAILIGIGYGIFKKKEYLKSKIELLKLKLFLVKGSRKDRREQFLTAFTVYTLAITKCSRQKKDSAVLRNLEQKREEALTQLENKIQQYINGAVENIQLFKSKNQPEQIIEVCKPFFTAIKTAPQSLIIQEQVKVLSKERNEAITEIFRIGFRDVLSFTGGGSPKEVISRGKEFLIATEGYSRIPGIRIFRQNTSKEIQHSTVKIWQKKFETLKEEIKVLLKRKRFYDSIHELESFIQELPVSETPLLANLYSKAEKKIKDIQFYQTMAGDINTYQNYVDIAMRRYEDAQYEKAIKYMKRAIIIIKGKNLLLLNTSILIKDFEFIFLCEDKIKEQEIEEMMTRAQRSITHGNPTEALSLYMTAQRLHDKLSTIYQRIERKKYKLLLQNIRFHLHQGTVACEQA